ncbi:MAG: TRAP transporter small permease [Pseudomonadota bacterium]
MSAVSSVNDPTGPTKSGAVSRALDAGEAIVLTAMTLGILALAVTQIVLRNMFDSGLNWADPLLRLSVLWLGLIGAVAAARAGRNIRIDLVGRFLPAGLTRGVETLNHLTAAGVCGLLAWHGGRMVALEREFADTGVLGLAIWVQQTVIPVAFGIMALLYLLQAGLILAGRRGGPGDGSGHGPGIGDESP